jgi:hypothetical protein
MSSILEDVITAEAEGALGAGSGPDALVRELARRASARADIASARQGGARDQRPDVLSAVLRAAKQAGL